MPGAGSGELSLFGRWRWNVLAALFAALLLVELNVRRWRRAEVSETIDAAESRVGIRVVLASVLVSSALTGVLALLPLTSDEAVVPTAAELSEVIDTEHAAGEWIAARADARCRQCGVVESTRGIKPIQGPSVNSVEVSVRAEDGASRLFVGANSGSSANWRAGESVVFSSGRSSAVE